MEDVNKKIFIEYVSHLYSTDKSYEVIGKSIKAVKLFLESDYQVNRKGYKAYIRENAVELSDKPYIKDALCGFLNFLGIGYSRTRKEKSVKPLEKLSDVSEKNMKLMNEFVYYLTQDEDYSPHTLEIYSFSIRMLDLAGLRGYDLDSFDYEGSDTEDYSDMTFTESMFRICVYVTDNFYRDELYILLNEIFAFCRDRNIDIFWHIKQKMKYNELRPYKHGDKSY